LTFSGVGSSAPCPTPNLEDQVSIFIHPGDWVAQLYPQARSTHFSRLLRHVWATVGLFFSLSHGDVLCFACSFKFSYCMFLSHICSHIICISCQVAEIVNIYTKVFMFLKNILLRTTLPLKSILTSSTAKCSDVL
jgi:hypothetical protein